MEQSFSADTGGGGRESNIHLIPYIVHTVLYVLNTCVPARAPRAAVCPRASAGPRAAFTEVGTFAFLESLRMKR